MSDCYYLKDLNQETRVLILRSKTIKEFPIQILDYPNLVEIHIHSSNLTTVPSSITQLKNLEALSFESVNVILPNNLSELPKLDRLNVKTKQVLSDDFFDGLEQLTELQWKTGNNQLPSSFYALKNLKILRLYNINEIEGAINQLEDLMLFSLAKGGDLSSLPETLGDLKNLHTIYIQECPNLTNLPKSIGKNGNLIRLGIEKTPIRELPEGLEQSKDLHSLTCTQGQLTEIPDYIYQFQKLQDLRLPHNNIKEVSPKIELLSSLQNLDLRKNQLNKIPKTIKKLTQLGFIAIDGNPIKPFPIYLFRLPNLNYIDIYLPMAGSSFTQKGRHQSLGKKDIDDDAFIKYMYLWEGRAKMRLSKLSLEELLNVFPLNITGLSEKTIEYLCEKSKWAYQEGSLEAGAKILILGTLLGDKDQLNDTLTQLNITHTNDKTSQGITHVVFANRWAKPPMNLDNVVFMTEAQLTNWYQKKHEDFYLVNENKDTEFKNQIINLLSSTDEDNWRLAMELMEGGGVVKSVATELAFIAEYTGDRRLRRQALSLLEKMGSTKLAMLCKQLVKGYQGQGFNESMKKYAGTEVNMVRFAYLYHQAKRDNSSTYYIINNAPYDMKVNFIRQFLVKNNSLVISFSLSKIPSFIYEFPTIKKLILRVRPNGGKLVKADKVISKRFSIFQDLEHLEINSFSYNFNQIPQAFLELKSLKYLAFPSKNHQLIKELKTTLPACKIVAL